MIDCGEIIQGWKPSTTHALLNPNRTIYACDVIDRSMGLSFLRNLKLEINENNLLEKMNLSSTSFDLVMGQQLNKLMPKARGDVSVIIPRAYRCTDEFEVNFSCLKKLVTAIELTASQCLNKGEGRSAYIDIDTSLTSVQIAMYPGDGVSGYTRHCDRSDGCHHSHDLFQQFSESQRIITAIYYVTDEDWSETDGGFLTIFDKDDGSSHRIIPYADRMVLFRSDLVEHQVSPSNHRARLAITIWLYGTMMTGEDFPCEKSILSLHFDANQKHPNQMIPLPTLTTPSSNVMEEKIFVSIPAYRDTETIPTILSLYENAINPSRIFIGVVFQFDTTSQSEYKNYYNLNLIPSAWRQENVRSLILDYRHATGPCFARYIAQSLHRDEMYILQIDSHMRFRPNWDSYLIDCLGNCSNPQKSVLTAYPPSYYLPNKIPNETRASVLVPWKFDSDGMLRQKGRLISKSHNDFCQDGNIKCLLYAAGFNFSMSSVLNDCPYDRTLHHLFFGEEIYMAAR